jgi:hypothetical protein
MSRSLLGASTLCIALITACGRDVTFVDPRAATDPADSTQDDSTIVVRGDLDVTVTILPQDSALARALGFPGLALVGATVAVRRPGQATREGVTDSAGQARFEALVTGPWTVSVVRLLTEEEQAALPAGAEDVSGFAGGSVAWVTEAGTTMTVGVRSGRGGGVIISEVFAPIVLSPSGQYYYTGQFVELYNNGLETAYLDGMILGMLYFVAANTQISTCEESAVWREDSLGLWVEAFNRFPGTGRDYPLAPGTTAVVATDAIDHREFVPQLPDLSGASFEFIGSADVDNPAVPNLVDIGFIEYRSAIGHGLTFGSIDLKPFLAAPVDIDTLPQALDDANRLHVRIPRAAVLDVFTSRMTPEREAASTLTFCERVVHEVFDRESARLYDANLLLSLRRQILETLGDGRVILQRTGSSAADIELATPTPGPVP